MISKKINNNLNIDDQLLPTQLKNYQQDGYLILNNVIPNHVCDALRQQANDLVDTSDLSLTKTIFSTKADTYVKNEYFLNSGNLIRFFFEANAFNEDGDLVIDKNHAINKIGHALHQLDPLFYCFSHLQQIMQLADILGIIDPVILQSMYIFKQPHIGGEVNCHQDATYLYLKDEIVTGFWFALEDATIENGCLWGIPGGHRTQLKSRMIRTKQDEIQLIQYDKSPFDLNAMVPLEVKKGSLIVLHGLFPHMSHENKSAKSRHAYSIHMASRASEYAEDNWLKR